jgi:hypothetical protein
MYERSWWRSISHRWPNKCSRRPGTLAQLSGGEVRVLHLREREIMGGRGGVVDYETGEEARATAGRADRALAQDGIQASGEARDAPFGYAAREIAGEAPGFRVPG